MITYIMWGGFLEDIDDDVLLMILSATFMSIFTILADIVLMPIEIIALIIYKIIERTKK